MSNRDHFQLELVCANVQRILHLMYSMNNSALGQMIKSAGSFPYLEFSVFGNSYPCQYFVRKSREFRVCGLLQRTSLFPICCLQIIVQDAVITFKSTRGNCSKRSSSCKNSFRSKPEGAMKSHLGLWFLALKCCDYVSHINVSFLNKQPLVAWKQ